MIRFRVSPSVYHCLPVIGLPLLLVGGASAAFKLVLGTSFLPISVSLIAVVLGFWLYSRFCFRPYVSKPR